MSRRAWLPCLLSLALMLAWGNTAHAANNVFFIPKISTLGVGGDVGCKPGDYFAFRGNINGVSVGLGKFTSNGLDFGGHVDMFTLGALVDFYPMGGIDNNILKNFFVTGGLYYNRNEAYAEATVDSNTTYVVSGTSFRGSDIGLVSARIKYNPLSPYLGLGWQGGLTQDSGWQLQVTAGALFQGGADVTVSGYQQSTPGIDEAMRSLSDKIKSEADRYQVAPVVAVGLGYKF